MVKNKPFRPLRIHFCSVLTRHDRKIPWRLSKFQKIRQRRRLRAVDGVIATLDRALTKKGETLQPLERWKQEMPTEAQMLAKDKYTIFDRKEKRYRKAIHSKFDLLGCVLIPRAPSANKRLCRTSEVDEGLPAGQSAGILRETEDEGYVCCATRMRLYHIDRARRSCVRTTRRLVVHGR